MAGWIRLGLESSRGPQVEEVVDPSGNTWTVAVLWGERSDASDPFFPVAGFSLFIEALSWLAFKLRRRRYWRVYSRNMARNRCETWRTSVYMSEPLPEDEALRRMTRTVTLVTQGLPASALSPPLVETAQATRPFVVCLERALRLSIHLVIRNGTPIGVGVDLWPRRQVGQLSCGIPSDARDSNTRVMVVLDSDHVTQLEHPRLVGRAWRKLVELA